MSERSIPKLARRADGPPGGERLGLPLRGDRLLGLVLDGALGGTKRELADEDPAGRCRRLETRSRVHDVPGDHSLAELGTRVERDERLPRVHADPHLERERRIGLVHLRDRLLDRKSRSDRALGVVLVGDRRPEDRDDGVADELLDRAAVALELVPQSSVVGSEESADVLRVETLGALRRPDHVGEDDGDDLALLAA